MPQSLCEPTTRPHPGTRPMALLVLAVGVAIGGSLAGAPLRAIDPPVFAPVKMQPNAVAVQKPVRVIPLPVRDAPPASGG